MSTPVSRHTHFYAGNGLDRVDQQRNDPDWVAARLADPESLFLPIWRERSLVRPTAPTVLRLSRQELEEACPGGDWVLLGTQAGQAIFAVDVSAYDAPARLAHNGAVFEDLRRVGPRLPPEEAALLAQARALVYWRSRHRFCPACGAGVIPLRAGAMLSCSGCGSHHFPRTDPAVIMAVTSGERILLARSARFPPGLFSTLAGFVEPGESLEEAVAREVFEEVGVRVHDVVYHSSQPWPFPSSIMLGFTATATSQSITIDPSEIVEARWFDRADVAAPDQHGFALPGPTSIARRLIEDWWAA